MSLTCTTDFDSSDCDWWWEWDRADPVPLATKRGRKCCSCGEKIKVGDLATTIGRHRQPKDDIEERIYCGEPIYMANWYLCEVCTGLAISLDELGFCFELGTKQSIKQQIAEFREHERGAAPVSGKSQQEIQP